MKEEVEQINNGADQINVENPEDSHMSKEEIMEHFKDGLRDESPRGCIHYLDRILERKGLLAEGTIKEIYLLEGSLYLAMDDHGEYTDKALECYKLGGDEAQVKYMEDNLQKRKSWEEKNLTEVNQLIKEAEEAKAIAETKDDFFNVARLWRQVIGKLSESRDPRISRFYLLCLENYILAENYRSAYDLMWQARGRTVFTGANDPIIYKRMRNKINQIEDKKE